MELPDMLDYFYVVSYSIKVLHTTTDGSLSHVLAVWCWARDYHAAAAATTPIRFFASGLPKGECH